MTRRTRDLALTTLALSCAAAVGLAYLQGAMTLIGYPWDWSPDDGMTLDAATRIGQGLDALYNRTLPPWPWAYGPLLPGTLALLGAAGPSLGRARVIAGAWTLVLLLAVFLLVRRRAPATLALAVTALTLTPFYYTGFFLLLRVDGPMCALWALAALPLIPERLRRHADQLSWARALAGSLLLVAAVLTKATAVVHGLPLVVGWWLVDRRSLARLAATTSLLGLLAVGWLQWRTQGGFLYVGSLLGTHQLYYWQVPLLLAGFLVQNAATIALLLALLVVAARCGAEPLRDGSALMIIGGLLAVPLLAKGGSTWHYLLPLAIALCVLLGRVAGAVAGRRESWLTPMAALVSVVALASAVARPFPVPDRVAEATARAFYGLVRASVSRSHGPLLALRPDYAYVILGQPLEVDAGGSFYFLASAGVPGTGTVLRRLEHSVYSVVTWGPWFFPERGGWMQAFANGYRPLAACRLRFYFGPATFVVSLRRSDTAPAVAFPPLADCSLVSEPDTDAAAAEPPTAEPVR